ncbi:MAG: ABC transporter ATP-binding protein [Candidatus Freyarchaeota archaeon]|nr:ABC transporter ATP-binding protein [Candidatus Jordarchaeia archaeon]MBS7269387.1 ABC transporter ATP-binding protein [Candidatus Jordarchaeia archaeon]MBS7280686.1 ABC transporter ATP-binding protein [Candidatus Jordarchaeia archaeon]
MKFAIETKDLTKKFGEIVAVNKINLKVKNGETFGILGPNGAGKTTTVRMLNCILRPTEGTATVGGFDIIKEPDKVKRITGLLPESPGVYEKLTAREFLEFMGDLYDVPHSKLYNRMDEILELFELKNRENDLLEGFSRGMRQKVLLAATLITDPEIIFLDEPISGLDPASARMVKDMIKLLVSEAKKTFFICTHMLSFAEEMCGRIAIIDRGQIKIEGTLEEILRESKSKDLEKAYLKIVGKEAVEKTLLEWRT